jgi:hypothetical protein
MSPRLWLLVILALAGAFAPSRADARGAETCAQGFFATATTARPESESQVAGTHQGFAVYGYELASGYSQAAESSTTTLFRAVNPAEIEDALANGLQPGPNSFATGKWFATNAEDATQWGNALNGPGNSQIMQVEFPSSTVDQFMQMQRLDGIGPARFGTFEQINSGAAPVIKLWGGP